MLYIFFLSGSSVVEGPDWATANSGSIRGRRVTRLLFRVGGGEGNKINFVFMNRSFFSHNAFSTSLGTYRDIVNTFKSFYYHFIITMCYNCLNNIL